MLTIHVTNSIMGEATLTELPCGRGRKTLAPLYEAWVHDDDASHRFGVTRCSSRRLFGNEPPKRRYDWYDECPPNRSSKPYCAIPVRHFPSNTFALRLFEEDLPHQDSLYGIGATMRTNVLIHIGDPACSFGCLTIGGGRTELEKLETFITEHESGRIEVHIDSRYADRAR